MFSEGQRRNKYWIFSKPLFVNENVTTNLLDYKNKQRKQNKPKEKQREKKEKSRIWI